MNRYHTYPSDRQWNQLHGNGHPDWEAVVRGEYPTEVDRAATRDVFADFARAAVAANANASWEPGHPPYDDWAAIVENGPHND